MKLRRCRPIVLLLLGLHLSACTDGTSPEVATLIGTWEFVEIDGGGVTVRDYAETLTFTATSVTSVFAIRDCNVVGSYTFVDGTLTITTTALNGSECDGMGMTGEVVVLQAKVSGDTLTLVLPDTSLTVTITFTRA